MFDPKNERELADLIKKLFDSPELRKKLIEQGLQRSSEFTPKCYIKSVIEIIDELKAIRRTWDSGKPYRHL